MNRRHFALLSLAATTTRLQAATTPLTVGVIGHTTRGNYGHGLDTMWSKMPEDFRVVGVADADAAGLSAAVKKLGLEKGHSDYHVMLKELRPQVVAIGPRHIDQHRDMILAAVEHGALGIYLEKPFCRNLKEADEIISICEKAGTRLAIAHRNRYQPVLQKVAELIAAGEIGRVLELRARGKEDKRGGSEDMWVLGSHLFNLITFLGGKPLTCSATIYSAGQLATKADITPGAEGLGPLLGDEIHASFRMERGMMAHFSSVRLAGEKSAGFGVQVIGSKGVIDLRMDTDPTAQILRQSVLSPVKSPLEWQAISTAGVGIPEPDAEAFQRVNNHRTPAMDLRDAIRDKRAPLCSAEDGRTVMEMTFGVFASHVQGGRIIPLPLKERGHPLEAW
jgi:predicted dehydrogenase